MVRKLYCKTFIDSNNKETLFVSQYLLNTRSPLSGIYKAACQY